MLLNKKNINNIFYIFITLHLIVWTLAPSLTNNNLPLDTIEALAWGSNLDWGFNKHPPASAFFLEIFFQIFGNNDFIYYLLSQIFIIVAFFVIWKLASEFFKNKIFCFLSVLILEGIYFYNYTTPEFNVYIAEIPFWTLTVFYSWKSYKEDNLKNFILLGIVSAIGILSHYLFIYLLFSIDLFFIYIFFIKKEKKFNFKYILTLIIFFIIILPHLIWLNDNNFITLTYGIHRTSLETSTILSHIQYPFIFIFKQIGILIPFWLLLFISIKKFKIINLSFKDKKITFLFFINFIPLILIFITSLILGAKIKTMWMTPFYLFFGLFFIYLFQDQINVKKLKNFFILFVFFFIFSPITYSTVSILKDDKRTDYQGKLISAKIQKQWSENYDEPINVVLGNEWEAGNISYHLKSRPVWKGFVTKDKLNSLSKFMCIEQICVGINEKN